MTTTITGETSDGYHTFNELYDHRVALFLVLTTVYPHMSWKSKLHHDGSSYPDFFLGGLNLPNNLGQIRYHIHVKHWSKFEHVPTLRTAYPWDGKGSDVTITRLEAFAEHLRSIKYG